MPGRVIEFPGGLRPPAAPTDALPSARTAEAVAYDVAMLPDDELLRLVAMVSRAAAECDPDGLGGMPDRAQVHAGLSNAWLFVGVAE